MFIHLNKDDILLIFENYLMNVEDKSYQFSNLIMTFQRNDLFLMNTLMMNLPMSFVVQLIMLMEFQWNQEDLKDFHKKKN
jgi:hypothetical protein